MGYTRAGFDVVGVDCKPQPHYQFHFIRADALAFVAEHGWEFDVIHASPPCQANLKGLAAVNRKLGRAYSHRDVIRPTRAALLATGKPYVIENVEGAALLAPVRYCGTSFGRPLRRHRLFESTIALVAPLCAHHQFTERKYWTSLRTNGEHRRSTVVQVYGSGGEKHEWGPALGIDWMTYDELAQAIPPTYTEHVGRQLLAALTTQERVA